MSRNRLRLSRIETKPKSVGGAHFVDHVGLNDRLKRELNELLDHIAQGKRVSERFYRSGIDRDHDDLLDIHGVMHLHLGGRSSDLLIFLIQFADHVELLEINDHKHFATRLVGHLIAALQSSWLRNMEREIAEAEAQAKQAAEAADRAAAELRAIEIRAALPRSGLLPKLSDETT